MRRTTHPRRDRRSVLAAAIAVRAFAARAHVPLRGTNWVLTDRVSLGTPLDGRRGRTRCSARKPRRRAVSGATATAASYSTDGSPHDDRHDGVSTLIACEGAAGKVEPTYLDAPRPAWGGTASPARRSRSRPAPAAGCSCTARRSARRRSPAAGTSPASTPATRSRRRSPGARSRSSSPATQRLGRLRVQHLRRRRTTVCGRRRASTLGPFALDAPRLRRPRGGRPGAAVPRRARARRRRYQVTGDAAHPLPPRWHHRRHAPTLTNRRQVGATRHVRRRAGGRVSSAGRTRP